MTVRIDSLRNRLAETRKLLTMVEEELEDLHVLAYDRPSAVDEAKVAGGSSHYYLDTHGDQRARSAYKHLWTSLDNICGSINGAATNALNLLREGGTPTNQGPRTVQISELVDLVAAQARRARTDGYTPVRRGPQPDEGNVIAILVAERDNLRKELDKAKKEIARLQRSDMAA